MQGSGSFYTHRSPSFPRSPGSFEWGVKLLETQIQVMGVLVATGYLFFWALSVQSAEETHTYTRTCKSTLSTHLCAYTQMWQWRNLQSTPVSNSDFTPSALGSSLFAGPSCTVRCLEPNHIHTHNRRSKYNTLKIRPYHYKMEPSGKSPGFVHHPLPQPTHDYGMESHALSV